MTSLTVRTVNRSPGSLPLSSSKQQARTQATRRKLLRAAERIFARDGFEAARLEDIAAAAGYTRGAFYANFDSKEALFLELLSHRQTDRITEAAQALDSHEVGTGEAAAELGRLLIDVADKDIDFAPLQAEFWLYAERGKKIPGHNLTLQLHWAIESSQRETTVVIRDQVLECVILGAPIEKIGVTYGRTHRIVESD